MTALSQQIKITNILLSVRTITKAGRKTVKMFFFKKVQSRFLFTYYDSSTFLLSQNPGEHPFLLVCAMLRRGWGWGIDVDDTNRINKLTKRAGSVIGRGFHFLEVVIENKGQT